MFASASTRYSVARPGSLIRLRMRLRPFGRLDHVLVGAATWILAFLLEMFVTWSGIILCFAHNPSVRATERFWLFLVRVRAAFFRRQRFVTGASPAGC
jgi:hypothetical protein